VEEYYYTSTPESDLVDILHDRCMKKEIADKIRREETMEDCWEALGKLYHRPVKAAEDLMAEITAFKKMRDTECQQPRHQLGTVLPSRKLLLRTENR
jgi:hypothetical protein